MAADLECYDDAGYATLTASTLFGRTLGTFTTGTANGSLYFAGLTSLGLQGWLITAPTTSAEVCCLPTFTMANDVLSWTFTDFAVLTGNAPRVGVSGIVGIP